VICSAGDKALAAALCGAVEVVAVDRNPAQVHLLELKLAALQGLPWEAFWALFAAGRAPQARSWYDGRLRRRLPAASRGYWDRWIGVFDRGLHEHSRLGAGTRLLRRTVRVLAGRRELARLRDAVDVEAQSALYRTRLAARIWNPVTRQLALRAGLLSRLNADPLQWQLLVQDRFLAGLEARVDALLRRELLRENPFWHLVLTGRPCAPEHEVRIFDPAVHAALSRRAAAVVPRHASLLDVLAERRPASLDAIDVFDAPDWMSAADRSALWQHGGRVLRPGGRLLVRSVLRQPAPPDPGAGLVVDAPASALATRDERTSLYGSVTLLRRAGSADVAGSRL
jgi:betaine lipid synthase